MRITLKAYVIGYKLNSVAGGRVFVKSDQGLKLKS